jgi:hypothetical protein
MHLKATIQSESFSFQAELFPVHSPLLRESCLVYFPPLTYMLKFSRFADLTSCFCNCINYHMNAQKSFKVQVNLENLMHHIAETM